MTATEPITAQRPQRAEMTPLQRQYSRARGVNTPLIAITTPDQAMTSRNLADVLKTRDGQPDPIAQWDIVRGLVPFNEPGYNSVALMACTPQELERVNNSSTTKEQRAQIILDAGARLTNPAAMLVQARRAPERTVILMLNAQNYFDGKPPVTPQALWNLRDVFKTSFRQVVMLGPSFTLPPEIANDVVTLDEPLPNEAALTAIAQGIMVASGISDDAQRELLPSVVKSVTGLSAFAAEQVVAMSVQQRNGVRTVSLDQCWSRTVQAIEQTPGLKVWKGGETTADMRGNEAIRGFLEKYFRFNKPACILWIDEIEKNLSNTTNDSSGVSSEQMGKMLSWMENQRVTGNIFVGPPGAGKSYMAKIAGSIAGCPTIHLDLADMKNSLVGASNQRLSAALKMLDAISGHEPGKIFCIATSNGIQNLAPELIARFDLGTFFFDLPDRAEKDAIWDLLIQKHGLDPNQRRPEDRGWAHRDLAKCARNAQKLQCTLIESAQYVVSASQSSGTALTDLRRESSGRYLSANHPGVYVYDENLSPEALDNFSSPSPRRMEFN